MRISDWSSDVCSSDLVPRRIGRDAMKKLTAGNFAPALAAVPLLLAACGQAPSDPRGVDRLETLLSVSATGRAEARPDKAEFQAGIQTWARRDRKSTRLNSSH